MAMELFPLSLSGPASAMLLTMGMSPLLLLGKLNLAVLHVVLPLL